MPLESLDCPNCGAPLPDPEGRLTVRCEHCHSIIRLSVPSSEGKREALVVERGDVEKPYVPPAPRIDQLPPLGPLPPDEVAHIAQLLREGRKIQAISTYQKRVGGSLAEARAAVDNYERLLGPAPAREAERKVGNVDLDHVRDLLSRGQKIEAIKYYREQTGLGLKESKDAVDAIESGLFPTAVSEAELAEARLREAEYRRERGLGEVGQMPKPRTPSIAPARGCMGIALAIVIFMLLTSGGCGLYLQTKVTYRCAMEALKTSNAMRARLGDSVNGGYLVLTAGFEDSGNPITGTWSTDMAFFTPMWGSEGMGVAYVEAAGYNGSDTRVRAWLFKDWRREAVIPQAFIDCP